MDPISNSSVRTKKYQPYPHCTLPSGQVSNGEAGHFVQTFKQAMQKEKGDVELSMIRFLLCYSRKTPHSETVTSRTNFQKAD